MHPLLDENSFRKAFPWVPGFQSIVRGVIPRPFTGTHLMLGSDYSGSHTSSDYRVYGYLLADADFSPHFPELRRRFRAEYLPDGRRMSYKSLNDALRRKALLPLLDAAEALAGICCVVVVHKELVRMSTGLRSLDLWQTLHGLDDRWAPPAFENMTRIVFFVSVLLGVASRPNQHVTWITDEDEIVANDDRLTDVMNLMDSVACMFVDHPLGEFAMNSTKIDSGDRAFEDFVAIPDLVAGSFADLVTGWAHTPEWRACGGLDLEAEGIPRKASLIGTWFCSHGPNLKRCAVIIDRYDGELFGVRRLCVGT